jgi:peptide/nickel transport system substrate-binding protein
MRILIYFKSKPWGLLASTLAMVLLLAVACGSAAQPDAQPADTSTDQQPIAQPTTAPVSDAQPTSAPAPADVAVHPGKLTWMVGGWGSANFDYTYDVGGANNYLRFFSAFLVETNEKTELLPGIASEWGLSEDGRTWTVTVRDDVKFHDGTPVTAEDVLWTWQHQWDPGAVEWATQSGAQSRARIMEKIEQTGPDQVSLTTNIVDASFDIGAFSAATSGPWPIFPKRDALHDEAAVEAYAKNPIGAGPMSFVRHVPSEVMEFERFDDYYFQPDNGFYEDRRVKFTSLDLRLVPEEATRVAAIRAGEADIAPVSLDSKEPVEASGGRLVFGQEGVYVRVMLMGCWDPNYPCEKQQVRQALAYAIDKEVMRDQLFGGPEVFQVKGWAKVTPSTIGYSPDLDPSPYDPEKARQLLSEAGYPNGEGFGKLIVNTWQSSAMPFLPESAQLAADFWKTELGIDAEVRVGDESDLKKATLARTLNGQILWRDNETGIDAVATNRSSYGTPDHTSRLHERPELFELGEQAMAETDPAKIEAALNSWYQTLREEQYELGIGYVNIPWAVSPRVLTWEPYPLAFFPSAYHTITLEP